MFDRFPGQNVDDIKKVKSSKNTCSSKLFFSNQKFSVRVSKAAFFIQTDLKIHNAHKIRQFGPDYRNNTGFI